MNGGVQDQQIRRKDKGEKEKKKDLAPIFRILDPTLALSTNQLPP